MLYYIIQRRSEQEGGALNAAGYPSTSDRHAAKMALARDGLVRPELPAVGGLDPEEVHQPIRDYDAFVRNSCLGDDFAVFSGWDRTAFQCGFRCRLSSSSCVLGERAGDLDAYTAIPRRTRV